jgi:hypothetical protein
MLYDLLGPVLWGAMTGLPARAPVSLDGVALPDLPRYTAAALAAAAASTERSHASR